MSCFGFYKFFGLLLPLAYIPYTLYYLFKNSTTFIVRTDAPKMIADRRYRGGYRLENRGTRKERIEIYNRFLDKKTVFKGKIKGLIWLAATSITLYADYLFFTTH